MKRLLALLLVPALFIACGGKSKGAKVSGLVHDPLGASIPQAMVNVEGAASQQTANNGTFSLETGTGMHHLGVSAAGFYPLDTSVELLAGMNTLDLILQPCDPLDTSCTNATPTPTATPSSTPTAPPGANIILAYSGSNYPGSGGAPTWTGDTHDNRPAPNNVSWGDHGNGGQNDAVTECYKSNNQPLSGAETSALIAYCIIDYYLVGGAINTGMGYQDAVVELTVDGPTWALAAPDAPGGPVTIRCTAQQPNATCILDYYEVAPGPMYTKFATAVDGVADIVDGGFKAGQTAVVSNGAFTGLDFP